MLAKIFVFPSSKEFFIIAGVINALQQIAGIFLTLAAYKLETLHYYVNVSSVLFFGKRISQYATSGEEKTSKNNSYLLPSETTLNVNCVGVSLMSTNKVFSRALRKLVHLCI